MAQPTFDPADVAALLLRDLTDDELRFAVTLSGMVWRRMLSRRAALDDDPPAATADVIAAVVARIIRNPEGFRAESDGSYSYSRMGNDPSALLPTVDEWRLLLPRAGAFSINPLASTAGDNLPWWDSDGLPDTTTS